MSSVTTSSFTTPGAVTWFRVYAVLFTLMYLGVVVLGVLFVILGEAYLEMPSQEALLVGGIMAVMSVPFALAYIASFFLPRKPWVWVYDLVLIAVGLTSCLTMPFAIPLLIYWLKADVKAWFGRAD